MAATWTALADKAALDVITPTIWNAILGDEGNLQYIYERMIAVKYKSATQVFTTNTTLADITASSGNFAFDVAASGVYVAHFELPITFGGTGGLKMEFSGPAAPTAVSWQCRGPKVVATARDSGAGFNNGQAVLMGLPNIGSEQTGFSTATAIGDSGGVAVTDSSGNYTAGLVNGTFVVDLLVVNGVNAGTVTLRAAQNSANSTTTFAVGSRMRAWRVS